VNKNNLIIDIALLIMAFLEAIHDTCHLRGNNGKHIKQNSVELIEATPRA
jgi:hypothetical protein